MSKTDYLENKILDHTTGKTSYTMPSVWIGLFTAIPGDAGGGTEVSGGSYARKATTGADWDAAAGGVTQNATVITFVTASAPWGTVGWFGLFDASTAGNLLRHAPLTVAKDVGTNDICSFPIGNLVLTED